MAQAQLSRAQLQTSALLPPLWLLPASVLFIAVYLLLISARVTAVLTLEVSNEAAS